MEIVWPKTLTSSVSVSAKGACCASEPVGQPRASPPVTWRPHGGGARRRARGVGTDRLPRPAGSRPGGSACLRRGRPGRRVPSRRRLPDAPYRADGSRGGGAVARRPLGPAARPRPRSGPSLPRASRSPPRSASRRALARASWPAGSTSTCRVGSRRRTPLRRCRCWQRRCCRTGRCVSATGSGWSRSSRSGSC
jgi:hypothetical protein